MALTNAQYDAIMREYDKRQLHNHRIQEARKAEVYANVPGIKEIDDRISSCALKQAGLLLNGDAGASDAFKQELANLKQERLLLLESNGYPLSYLDNIYSCLDCKDKGYIGTKKCHCLKQAMIDVIYSQSNIKDILEKENFNRFSMEYYSKEDINPTTNRSAYETAENAVKDCQNFVEHFEDSFQNILFYGDTGVGKTFLSNCVAKELLDKGYSVIYFTAFQLFDILSKGVFEKDSDAIQAHRNIFDCDLLVIDDLGTELSNTFTVSQLFLCINERILRGKSTIISTNLNLGQLSDRYSERTFSRIMDHYMLIKLFTTDIRLQKRQRHL